MPRTLQCCPGCSRQFDTGALSPGSPIACDCGVRFAVAALKPHAARAMCCSRCGGNLRENARACEYCEAAVTLEERRLDSICPACFGRMSSDANFCMSCGVRIQAQALAPLPAASTCPRCAGPLRSRRVGADQLVECTGCAGLWVEPRLLDRLCEDAGARKSVAEMIGGMPAPKAAQQHAAAYIRCPNCAQPMNRKNFASISGVLIDVCREHGVWLDHGELARALSFAEGGGLVEARRREVGELERRKQRAQSDAAPGAGAWLEPQVERGWGRSSRSSRASIGGLLGWLASELLE